MTTTSTMKIQVRGYTGTNQVRNWLRQYCEAQEVAVKIYPKWRGLSCALTLTFIGTEIKVDQAVKDVAEYCETS